MERQIVMQINLEHLLSVSNYQTVSNMLFGRRGHGETPKIRTLVNNLCVGTRTKMALYEVDEKEAKNKNSILIFWRYYPELLEVTLPRFESLLISLYEKKKDRNFDLLARNKSYEVLGTDRIRVSSPPELMYLRKQLIDYVEYAKGVGKVEILQQCNK